MYQKILNKILGWFGLKIIDKKLYKTNKIISQYTYLNLNKILEIIFKSQKINNLIQIGSNDGVRFDELNFFIKKYRPMSILVEPIKKYFDQLKANYKNINNIYYENCAILNKNDSAMLYSVKENKLFYYDDHIHGINSFDKNHLIKHGVSNNHIVKNKIISLTLKELINKYNLKKIDLLYVDAEGYDGNIVLDFLKNFNFKTIIIFEYIHIDSAIFKEVIKKLKNKKYNFFSIKENLICFPDKKNFLN